VVKKVAMIFFSRDAKDLRNTAQQLRALEMDEFMCRDGNNWYRIAICDAK